jgi:hypothetical protein
MYVRKLLLCAYFPWFLQSWLLGVVRNHHEVRSMQKKETVIKSYTVRSQVCIIQWDFCIKTGQILDLPLRLVGQLAVSVAVGDRHRPEGVGQDPLGWERPIKRIWTVETCA